MNLIILTEKDFRGDGVYEVSDKRAEHIISVLKLTTGDTVEIGLLNGAVGVAEITFAAAAKNNNSVKLVIKQSSPAPAASPEIDIICAVPRPQTLKKILLTSAMMGVRSLHLVRANRTEKSYLQSPTIEPMNQLPHLLEGLSQGKRTTLPQVRLHPLFRPFIEDSWPEIQKKTIEAASGSKQVLLLSEVSATQSALSIAELKSADSVTIAIGPEGGWIDFEIEHFCNVGFVPFCLGPWVLRVEHALTAALSQVSLVGSSD